MPNAAIVIFVIFLILAVVTLVGHGIWSVLAAIFGSGKNDEKPKQVAKCPFCGYAGRGPGTWCLNCGKSLNTPLADELADLAAVARQLRRLGNQGTLSPEAVQRWLNRIERYRRQLLAPPAERPEPEILGEADEEPPAVKPAAPQPVGQALDELTAKPQAAPPPVPRPVEPALDELTAKPQAAPPAAPPPPAPPHRSWSEMLAGFMEERNIRWGEVIGGLLIVCSSIALVLSLWETLKQIPYIQFFIFVTICSAVFGVGLYAHYRWKLESTSRGMLIIATLLVPLNFVAMAALSKDNWTPVTLLSECVSLAIFAGLVWLAARVLVPEGRWLTVLPVVGNSAAVLVWARLISGVSPAPQVAAAGGASAGFFAAMVIAYLYRISAKAAAAKGPGVAKEDGSAFAATPHVLPAKPGTIPRRFGQSPQLDAAGAGSLFTLTGAAAFALAVAAGLLVVQALGNGDRMARAPEVFESLSLMLVLAAAAVLAGGLTVFRGVRRDPALAGYQTAGICVAVTGMGAMLAALGLAWPHPGWLVAVGLLSAATLAAAAFCWRLPILHAGAIAAAVLAYLLMFHRTVGDLTTIAAAVPSSELLRLTISARSGTALAGMFVILAALSEWLVRRGRHRHGLVYMGGAAVVAVAGLTLVSAHGWRGGGDDALRAAALYSLYGVGSLALAGRWRRLDLSYLGLALLGGAPLWLLAWHPATRQPDPLWAAVMGGEAFLMAAVAALLHRLYRYPWDDPAARLSRLLAAGDGPDAPGHHRAPSGHRREALVGDGRHGGEAAAVVSGDTPATPQAATKKARRRWPLAGIYQNPLAHVAEIFAAAGLVVAVITCWRDAARISADPAPVAAAVLLAAACLLTAWAYRSAWRTWAGSLVVLAGTLHALNFNYFDYFGLTERIGPTWTVALLAHATLALAAALGLDRVLRRRGGQSPGARIQAGLMEGGDAFPPEQDDREMLTRAISRPLIDSALLSSLLVPPALLLARSATTAWLTACYPWLAAVWLVLAWRKRSAALFAAHQVALATGVLVGTTIVLKHLDWVVGHHELPPAPNLLERLANVSHAVLDPRNLQAYGISLGLLSIVWIIVRIVDRATGGRAAHLIDHRWTVDRVVLNVVAAGQFLVPLACLVPGQIARELLAGPAASVAAQNAFGPTVPAAVQNAFGPAAWLLLAVLLVMLAAALWERWHDAELFGLLLWAGTVPLVAAGHFCNELAVTSSLRWAWPTVFFACLPAVWQRRRLAVWCRRAGMRAALGPLAAEMSRDLLVVTLAIPAILLTLVAAAWELAGMAPPASPAPLARLGPTWSYVVPLVVVALGLVGLAVRECSAGYAFAAGLVVEMAVVLGYALHVEQYDLDVLVLLVQLATITAALWAIIWLVARRWLDVWREGPAIQGEREGDRPLPAPVGGAPFFRPRTARVLMDFQLGMAILGNVLVLGWALLTLVFAPLGWQGWCIAAGWPAGWIALILSAVAVALAGRLRPDGAGLLGLAALGLAACTVRGLESWGLPLNPLWGYRTLMIGWAGYALLVVAGAWRLAVVRTPPETCGPPQSLLRAAAVWVCIPAVLAVLLGLRAARVYAGEQLWAAAAIAVASIAGATMAVWRRREGWALAAALGVNLAASLVVWHFEEIRQHPFHKWWLRLVQANIIASAAVALVWLAARKRLYELRELTVADSPLLGLQVALPVAASLILLVQPVVWLLGTPGWLPAWMAGLGAAPGWLALGMAAVCAAWYLRQTLPGNLLHVLGGLGLGAGVLAACAVATWDPPSTRHSAWLAYHTLVAAWASTCLALLGIAWLGRSLRDRAAISHAGRRGQSPSASSAARGALAEGDRPAVCPLFPTALVEFWLALAGALTVGLVLWDGRADPARPWWSVRAVLAVSVVAAMTALWLRRTAWTYVSGLLLNVAGILIWMTWEPRGPGLTAVLADLLETNVLALALNSAIWSLLGGIRIGDREAPADDPRLPLFGNQAAQCGTALICLVVGMGAAADLAGWPHLAVTRLDVLALGAIIAAVAVRLWEPSARFGLATLYSLGLAAIGMSLWAGSFPPREFCWAAAFELAGYLLAAAVLGWLLPKPRRLWAVLKLPSAFAGEGPAGTDVGTRRSRSTWFPAAQAAVLLAAGSLAAWVSIDFAFDVTRIARLLPAGRLVGPGAAGLLLAAAVVMAAACVGGWRAAWQYAALAAGVLAGSCLGWSLLAAEGRLPWLHRAVILMSASAAAALVAGAGLGRVLPGGSDWIARGRRGAPLLAGLAVAMFAVVLAGEFHYFEPPNGAPLAPWAIAAVAAVLAGLAGACITFAVTPRPDPWGLSDRGRQVYVYAAEAVTALAGLHVYLTMHWLFHGFFLRYWMFLVMAVAFAGAALSEFFRRRRLPVLSQPLERTCLGLPLLPAAGFWCAPRADVIWGLAGRAPSLWFLVGAFYGILAVSRRSLVCTALSVLTTNLGLWVALNQSGIPFLRHPQAWLIPLALAGLVAELVNRHRLTPAQSAAFRYFALSVIYVSSTADMYIAGVGEDWRLPLVLMVLAVVGVLAGILFRVQSFLYLGTTFLLVDILSILWYAAVDLQQTWIWYACGIALGAFIIALFAVFEKRRNDVLAAVQRLKEWKR
jgi:hypothetical protein